MGRLLAWLAFRQSGSKSTRQQRSAQIGKAKLLHNWEVGLSVIVPGWVLLSGALMADLRSVSIISMQVEQQLGINKK